jgi:phage tail protein X
MLYQIRQTGLTVDLVCHIHYGHTDDVTEAVYDANPGLAAHGLVLPIGTTLILPEMPKLTTKPVILLWE